MSTTTSEPLRSKYTDQQLADAFIAATELSGGLFIRGILSQDGTYKGTPTKRTIEDMHAVLHVLDTQDGEDASPLNDVLHAASDDWQPTALADIDMTDEAVLALYADGSGIQGKPDGISDGVVCISVNGQNVCVSREDVVAGKVWLYRIPAPVIHPNPAEHPVIVEQGGKGWTWNAQQEMYHQPHSSEYRSPEGFTDWGPAHIVSDEPAEVPHG